MSIGRYGEKLAKKHLLYKGYQIIARNYRTKYGEIDIIAKNREALIFCEVKTRKSIEFGEPIEAVDFYKEEQLKKLADCYLANQDIDNLDVRFDIIAIKLGRIKKDVKIEHVEGAFY